MRRSQEYDTPESDPSSGFAVKAFHPKYVVSARNGKAPQKMSGSTGSPTTPCHASLHLRRFRVLWAFVCVARRLSVIVSTRDDAWWSFF